MAFELNKNKIFINSILLASSVLPLSVMAANDNAGMDSSFDNMPALQDISTRQNNDHAYVGVRAGWGAIQSPCSEGDTKCNSDEVGYGLYGGYQFTSWFAVEGSATYYGFFDANYYDVERTTANLWGAGVSGVFTYDLSEDFDAYLRVGVIYQGADRTRTWEGHPRETDISGGAAIGLDYMLSEGWSLRGEYEYDGNFSGMHFVSMGLTYHFGQSTKPAPIVEVAPIIIPVVEEIIVIEPVVTVIVLTSEDIEFATSSAVIKPSAKVEELVNTLSNTTGEFMIIGYTDSTGADAFNQKLSERRAQAVATLLIERGIDANRIVDVEGKGESNPIASNQTVAGRAQNRRVEIIF